MNGVRTTIEEKKKWEKTQERKSERSENGKRMRIWEKKKWKKTQTGHLEGRAK